MPHWIAKKPALARCGGAQDPDKGAVWRRMLFEEPTRIVKIRHPGLVQLKNRLSGLSGEPLGLGKTQRIQIELRTFRRAVPTGDPEIMNPFDFRKMGTRGIHLRRKWFRSGLMRENFASAIGVSGLASTRHFPILRGA